MLRLSPWPNPPQGEAQGEMAACDQRALGGLCVVTGLVVAPKMPIKPGGVLTRSGRLPDVLIEWRYIVANR